MNDTPRTDAAKARLKAKIASDIECQSYEDYEVVPADFARAMERENAKLRELLKHMLDVAENADETGYVTDAGFVDLDELHAEVRSALQAPTT